jgi:hypothetical protein
MIMHLDPSSFYAAVRPKSASSNHRFDVDHETLTMHFEGNVFAVNSCSYEATSGS